MYVGEPGETDQQLVVASGTQLLKFLSDAQLTLSMKTPEGPFSTQLGRAATQYLNPESTCELGRM